MHNLIKADLYKIFRMTGMKILLLITSACAIIMTVMAYYIPQGKIPASYTGVGFLFSDVNIMSIIGAVAAGILLCGDFDNKTIHDAISSGISRTVIVVGKSVTYMITIMVLLLPYVIATLAAVVSGKEFGMGSVGVGFLNIMANSGGTLDSNGIIKTIAIMAVLLIVYAGMLSLCIPIAFATRKPVIVVAVYYVLTIVFANLSSLRSDYSFFDKIMGLLPFGGDYSMLTAASATSDIVKGLAVSIIFGSVIVALTAVGFQETEIR